MANLSTKYLGLDLKSPIIAGSSGLTSSLKNIVELERQGAGAVVLKSIFEEQIKFEAHQSISFQESPYPEAWDYIHQYTQSHAIDRYLQLISEAKKNTSLPIIASINCITASQWTSFARQIEQAGADALELNIFILPSDPFRSGEENEKLYFDIVKAVLKEVKIPVSIKLSWYFSSLAKTLLQLSWTGIQGMVLFNRFYSPEIDLDNLEVTSGHVFSQPGEITLPLRWIAMLSDRVHCDLAGSTGVDGGEAALKLLLAGAKAVQMASVLYRYGFSRIADTNQQINSWLDKHGYGSLEEVIGKMSLKNVENPASYERVQFMRHFAGIE
ncbi:MAG TPA: diguanylate cyclase [Bacteroidales bacterium]|nr:diguanylate cyclase [Bacteroidales bacterium]